MVANARVCSDSSVALSLHRQAQLTSHAANCLAPSSFAVRYPTRQCTAGRHGVQGSELVLERLGQRVILRLLLLRPCRHPGHVSDQRKALAAHETTISEACSIPIFGTSQRERLDSDQRTHAVVKASPSATDRSREALSRYCLDQRVHCAGQTHLGADDRDRRLARDLLGQLDRGLGHAVPTAVDDALEEANAQGLVGVKVARRQRQFARQ